MPELCSDTDRASGQLKNQLWCLSGQGGWVRALRKWGCPLWVCFRSATEWCWTLKLSWAFSMFKKSTGYPWRTTWIRFLVSLCATTNISEITCRGGKNHSNLLFSNSPRKTSLKYRGAFLLEAAVHSSQLAGLSSTIKLFATCCSVALQQLCQTSTAQWGNPSCRPSKRGLCRRKQDLKRKDVTWWATAFFPWDQLCSACYRLNSRQM